VGIWCTDMIASRCIQNQNTSSLLSLCTAIRNRVWDSILEPSFWLSQCWEIKPTPWSGGSFWNVSLVYKFVCYIYSLVCNGIRLIPSQTNVRLGFCDSQVFFIWRLAALDPLHRPATQEVLRDPWLTSLSPPLLLFLCPTLSFYPQKKLES